MIELGIACVSFAVGVGVGIWSVAVRTERDRREQAKTQHPSTGGWDPFADDPNIIRVYRSPEADGVFDFDKEEGR